MKHFTLPKDGGLLEENLPEGILHSFEKIPTEIYDDSTPASKAIAEIIIKSIAEFDCKKEGRNFKLGLSTGVTPVSLYKVLSKRCGEGKVSFRNVDIFSIDEYYQVAGTEMQSRNQKLHSELLDNIDIEPKNIHILDGTVPQDKLSEYCAACAHLCTIFSIGRG